MFDNSSQMQQIHELYHQGRYDEVLVLCEQILKTPDLHPSFKAQVLRRKGDCLHRLKKFPQALALYDQAMSLVKDPDTAIGMILESKASTLSDLERYEEAIECVHQAISRSDEKIDLYHLQDLADEIMDALQDAREGKALLDQRQAISGEISARFKQLKDEATQEDLDALLSQFPKLQS